MRAGQRADGQNVAMGASPKSRDGTSRAGAPWTTTLEARVAQAEPNLSASRKRLIREISRPSRRYVLFCRLVP